MQSTLETSPESPSKAYLIRILIFSTLLPTLFLSAVQIFQFSGLPVYFMQLGVYALLYLLAFWGLKKEQITVPFSAKLAALGLAGMLIVWLLYALFLQLSGLTSLADDLQTLASTPAWKILANIISTWLFVGIGEELLFRGYILNSIQRHFTQGTPRKRVTQAVLLSSAVFSLWHLPVRIISIINGEMGIGLLLVSLVLLFILGLGFAVLYTRSGNIILVGLLHGIVNYGLIGAEAQSSLPTGLIILLIGIGLVELVRWVQGKRKNLPSNL